MIKDWMWVQGFWFWPFDLKKIDLYIKRVFDRFFTCIIFLLICFFRAVFFVAFLLRGRKSCDYRFHYSLNNLEMMSTHTLKSRCKYYKNLASINIIHEQKKKFEFINSKVCKIRCFSTLKPGENSTITKEIQKHIFLKDSLQNNQDIS